MDAIQNEAPVIDSTDRQWAGWVHLAALLAAFFTHWFAGVAGAVVALVVWLVVRDRHPFAAEHAKETLNFNITMFLGACAVIVAGVVLLGATVLTLGVGALVTVPAGLLLAGLIAVEVVAWLVCSILAAIAGWEGKPYRYPFSIRFVK
ncbi:DUF4870 domain-containing protein [Solilutibacter silvestris]|uniref:DUF4870 domain-containing protein n=1 Tax=Solilutibacter silvestris TaxID=1645665 RepID=A0A2K1Q3D2_9GAMM|nr:DUF4870 domain-containing protein [Lysobacter silvestris]PNS09534.1 hypothetical protein Lysil_1163 [Lysobacter silvestris]